MAPWIIDSINNIGAACLSLITGENTNNGFNIAPLLMFVVGENTNNGDRTPTKATNPNQPFNHSTDQPINHSTIQPIN